MRKGFTIFASILSLLYLLAAYLGEVYPNLEANSKCFRYFGCNKGFFGYDAFVHLIFGALFVFIVIWIFIKFPMISLMQKVPWKTILFVLAISALVSVVWELVESFHDVFRIKILHESLYSLRLQTNSLDQPSNLDTMGDIFFGLLGSSIALLMLYFFDKKSLTEEVMLT